MTSHSEYHKLKSVFLKNVKAAFIDQTTIASQWQSLNYLGEPHLPAALKEYSSFESLLTQHNIEIMEFPKDGTVSMDSLYCRDASIATDFGVIICNMGKEGRANEPAAAKKAYEEQNVKILGEIKSPGTVEGGDVAWLDKKTLAVGHTYRTNPEGIQQLKNFLNPHGVEVIVANLPHFRGPSDVFHLMSILSPVDKDLAVVYSPLMPIDLRNLLIDRGYELVEVPESEYDSMGCNVLAIAPRICLIVKGNPKTKEALEAAGCTVYEYEGQEISVKGGGGPTCLTRPLIRE